jgi:methyl-accepting chemotaxis protein
MASTLRIIRKSPGSVFKLGLILMLPWMWAAFVMPWWASVICVALSLAALLLGVRVLLAPMFKRRRTSDRSLSTEQIIAMRTQSSAMLPLDHQTVKGELGLLHKGLRRWKDSSTVSSGETATARERVAEVITQTESAVLALNQSFRGITTKTRQQMEAAMSLLKRNAEQVSISPGSWLSLPDYIRAYEMQLQEVIESMVKFAATSDEMRQHETKIREQSVLINELLDELRAMALRIGRLALDSAVAAGESGAHGTYLIELSGSIRETSNEALGLTRSIRQSLETIRDELVATYKVINKTVTLAKESGQRAKADVAQLNVTMIAKTKEVEESLSNINALGEAIQKDVNNAMIAMQFQDITQQKLEHMRGNILTDVMCSLDTLSVETQQMMKRKIFVATGTEPSGPGSTGNEISDATAKAANDPDAAQESADRATMPSDADGIPTLVKEVELF